MSIFPYSCLPWKRGLTLFLLFGATFLNPAKAQTSRIDSIFFNLYTDSLKKGVYNYINIDGKCSDGHWLPLTHKEIHFTSSAGKFDGNCLVIDTAFKGEKINVKAVLKENPAIWRDTTIYIKKVIAAEKLRTMNEVMNGSSSGRRRRGNNE